ncbi:SPOR domain-containing protein [Marinobacterium sp. D7]|uniref:SPOR domain-containing protein n=1 Tax=Marinobacterium ramblicola TaxID=2849041 RepID=UPI001C2D9452|nr:SPOR domain-containing protein [Marinobacterium ramblicola]MBV1786554.1 SPOR domain-containing protein [Marinobacterium ramblicola]
MNREQKKRVLGLCAVVIVGAAILPLLLDGAGYRERHLESRIPPAPEPVGLAIVEPQLQPLPSTAEPALPAEPAVVSVPVEPLQEAIDKVEPSLDPTSDTPGLDQEGVPVAWTLQLASFRDESNARALRSELLEAGYKVYIRHMAGLVKVFVGPELQRTRLEKLQAQLKQEYALDGIVVRFTTQ